MARGPAAFAKQADEDVAAVNAWIKEAEEDQGISGDEVFFDIVTSYIAAEIGSESHPRARELRRRFGL